MILEVKEIHTYYGTSHILFGVSIDIKEGEAVCLLGRNGAGKTTTLRSIIGLTAPRSGSIKFNGKEITGKPPYRIAPLGIGFVPDDRRIFPDLTVRQNILIARRERQGAIWNLDRIYSLFPKLKSSGHPYGNATQRWGAADAHDRPNLDDQSSTASFG